jgi:CubicO group peptidase (beta-lactamase class C family)
MDERSIPGFSISVCDKEKIIFSETYGFTDLSENNPVTPKTMFCLLSVSKTYTAFGFMLAVQDGKVSLDDPVKKYLPDFYVRHRDGCDYSSLITFRKCLTHRSGLKHEAPIGSNYDYTGTFDEHIKSINGTFLRFKPGGQCSYSNLGIDIAAYVLGKIYEMPFEEYMLKKVFTPLEMANSTYSRNDYLMCTDRAAGHVYAYPIRPAGGQIMPVGASGMYSCPEDMTHFIRCFLNHGVYNGRQIIKREILEQMYNEYPSEEWAYNLGLTTGITNNRTLLHQNGGGFGYKTTQNICINDGLGAAAMINHGECADIQLTIIGNMWDDLFTLQDAGKDDCEPLPDSYKSLIGLYEAESESSKWTLSVTPRNGGIYCSKQKLKHHSGSLFFNENNDCIEFTENGMIYDNVAMFKLA